MEEGGKGRLDGGSPAYAGKADPACEQDLGHRLCVLRPGGLQRHTCGLRGRRPMLGETVEVTQQQCLVAWVLPDDADIELIGELLGLLPALIIVLHLIEVEQHRPACEFRAAPAAPIDLLGGAAQAGDGVAGAWTEVDDFEVNRSAGGLQQIVEQLAIGLLGFPFATQKDRRFGFDDPTAHPHPT
nr:hypothetical protein [Mesorhizobium loti]